ncbi:MAG: 7-cyano-7-deazaguanine synthase QueC [Chloroflexota bacterium]
MSEAIAIVSGGLDSVTLLHYICKIEKKIPTVLTFGYGQKHTKEITFARYHADLLGCDDYQYVDLSFLTAAFGGSALVGEEVDIPEVVTVMGDPQPPTYVPNRNMIFLAIGAAYAESRDVTDIYYGAQRHDMYGYWDTTPQFLEAMNQTFNLNRKSAIQIKAPFVTYTKSDIIRLGLELDVDYATTWSCYQGAELACGVCPTCAERLKGFEEVGVSDPVAYQNQ